MSAAASVTTARHARGAGAAPAPDRRGSWIPTGGMIATRCMELRKRRGLLIALIIVTIGIPTIFLVIRLLVHAFAPKSYGPAGGYDIFTGLVTGVLYVFGFIVAAALGCTAGSIDLTEGMFRHLVVTGRSRVAIYLARIPAGLAVVWPIVAVGFTIVCAVCVFAAPTQVNYDGATLPAGMTSAGLQSWAANHVDEVLCDFDYAAPTPANIPCGNNGPGPGPGAVIKLPPGVSVPNQSPAAERAEAIRVARQDYPGYHKLFTYPSTSLMVKTGLWVELEAAVGLIVGVGLGSLLGQRTVAVILMIVLEIILTPIFSRANIPHLINVQRGLVGLATAHLEPAALPPVFGGDMGGGGMAANHGMSLLLPESTAVAICVVVAWLVGWTALGAWRMARRDA